MVGLRERDAVPCVASFLSPMPKLKTRKAAVKRLRRTRRGKITVAKSWAGPYRRRKSRRARRAKNQEQPLARGQHRQAERLLAN